MMRFFRWLFGLIFQNAGWKLLALVIAFVIWGMVSSEPELSTVANARVLYKNLPDGLEISRESDTSVELELKGPSAGLRGLGENGSTRPGVELDLAGVRPGEHTFPIGDGEVKLPRGIHLVRSKPPEIRFEFEKRVELDVPVAVRIVGEGANGYVVARRDVRPESFRLTGPESRVKRVMSVSTDPVDVSALVGAAEFKVNAFVTDSYVRFQSPPQVTVSISMKKK
jgi:hypothetical protein